MTVPPTTQSIVTIAENKVSSAGCWPAVSKWCSSYWRPVLAELVSTTLLILLGCMSTIPIGGLPFQPSMYTPFSFGCVVMFNIQIFGHISGAHMNPAVTLAAVIWGSLSIPMGIAYFLAQFVGAIVGYSVLTVLSPVDVVSNALCVTKLHTALNQWQALVVEVVLTSTLNFLNCGVWDPINKNKQDSIPLKFGLAIIGLSLIGGPLTGASMNPTRSFAPALFTGSWKHHWVYWIGPLIGGIIPTLLYKFTWLKKENPKADISFPDRECK